MDECGGVKGQGRNMGFGNNQTLKCTGVESPPDTTRYPSQDKHPHYITRTDWAAALVLDLHANITGWPKCILSTHQLFQQKRGKNTTIIVNHLQTEL